MDTDKIKVFGSKVRVQSTAKLAEIEKAEKVCLCMWGCGHMTVVCQSHDLYLSIILVIVDKTITCNVPLKPLQEKMKDKVGLILKHDINCFINRQLIYNYPEQLFADAGVMAIEHADFEGVERLALVLGELGWFL